MAFSLGGDRLVSSYLPLVGHVTDNVVLLDDGSVFAMFSVEGIPWETADVNDIIDRHDDYNTALRNIATDTLIISTYQCRGMADPAVFPPGIFRSDFAASLDTRYRAQLFDQSLYHNQIYIGLLIRPARYGGEMLGEQVRKRKKVAEDAPQDRLHRLQDICQLLQAKLSAYGPRRLGIIERGNALFTEIGEAIVFAMTGLWRPVGLSAGRMGNSLFSERIITGREAIEIRTPGQSFYAAMFGMREYPASTWPGMFAAMSLAEYRCTLFQSFRFLAKASADTVLNRKQNFSAGAGDKAYEQVDLLHKAGNDLMDNKFVIGDHTLSMIAFADTIGRLNGERGVATEAWRDLGNSGIVVAREGAALEAALFSMVPGNDRLRPRPGFVSSRNFAAMAPLHNFPHGPEKGHWGPPIACFRSSAGTPVRFHWHVGDVGNTLMSGETGSGKSLTAAWLIAMSAGRSRIIALDFKRGWELLILAMGGDYAVLGDGEPHLAPLKALDATPQNLQFLGDLIRGCIGRPLTAEEDRRLPLALNIVMSMPPADRSMGEIVAFLGTQADGAGALLSKWCLGSDLGWVIDAPHNTVDVSGDLQAMDLTALLENPRARGPALLTLFHYLELQLDGRPLLIPNDEGWRALLDPTFRPMIEKRLRTIRSYGGVFVFLTQGPEEIKASEIGSTLVSQCPTQILLPNPRANKADYQQVLKRTDGEWEAFRQLKKGEGLFLLCQGSVSTVASLPLHGMDDEIATLSARESVLRVLDTVRSERGDDDVDGTLQEVHRRRKEPVE